MKKILVFLVFLLVLQLSTASELKKAVSLAVTVYNDQFAIVKDVRSISFDQGRSDLYFTDVSSNIQTETVTFKALQNTETIKVFEQNYEANLINTKAILQKYIDNNIEISVKIGETSTRVNGTLLGYNSGYILKTSAGIEVYNNIDSIKFPALPAGFLTLPTLNWKVYSQKAVTADCQVAYRTTGFSWKSDYSLVLNGDETKADVGGWITIDNQSGKRYQNAKLKLIAGDVNLASNRNQDGFMELEAVNTMARSSAPSFSEKSFSDYHMYTLSEPVTLEENSQKQVQFVSKVYGIAVRKYNLITVSAGGYAQQNIKAANKIEIQNTQANKLGIPLPKGTVRAFKEDKDDGSLEFIGEDSIGHTPKDENITVTTGNSFDITANKLASNYQSFANSGFSAELNLTIDNHKDIEAEIVVQIHNYYGDNNQFAWKSAGIDIHKVSASLYRIIRKFKANEKFSLLWTQSYRA